MVMRAAAIEIGSQIYWVELNGLGKVGDRTAIVLQLELCQSPVNVNFGQGSVVQWIGLSQCFTVVHHGLSIIAQCLSG
jgi:hypothetical protein